MDDQVTKNVSATENRKRPTSSDDSTSNSSESQNVDGLLSRELMNLSLVDRNAILEEVHGVRCVAVQETPELIRRSLKEFQCLLEDDVAKRRMVTMTGMNAYDKLFLENRKKSRDSSTNYIVDDVDFRLRFLRCELFDVPKAARRFHNYLEFAYDFFGDIALERPIQLSDFTKAEMKIFRKGNFQILPFRDSSGRRVSLMIGGIGTHADLNLRDKLCFYVWDVITRDSLESQRKGFVLVRLHGDISSDKSIATDQRMDQSSNRINFREAAVRMNRVLAAIPSRLVANHFRVPNHPAFQLVGKFIVLRSLSGINSVLRSRFIMGTESSDMEFRYRLKSYGIPSQLFPITETNTIKCTYHSQWIRVRKHVEKCEQARNDMDGTMSGIPGIVECPGLNDVIFRKGSRLTAAENPGNRCFRDIIRVFLEEKARETEKLRLQEKCVTEKIWEESNQTATIPYCGLNEDDGDNFKAGNKRNIRLSAENGEPYTDENHHAFTASCEPGKTNTVWKQQATLNTEKAFCDWLVDYIKDDCDGRFLEWDTKLSVWVVMMDRMKIRRKVSVTLYNWGKRFRIEVEGKKNEFLSTTSLQSPISSVSAESLGSILPSTIKSSVLADGNNDRNQMLRTTYHDYEQTAYQFIEPSQLTSQLDCGWCDSVDSFDNNVGNTRQRIQRDMTTSTKGSNKKPRRDPS